MRKVTLLFLSSTLCLSLCACQKEVSSKSIKINVGENSYQAIYSGLLENGKPSGTGTIEINDYSIDFDGVELIGTYSGDAVNGVPDGTGEFISSADDYAFSYTGSWKDGLISGDGNLKYDKYIVHFDDVDREGNYVGETIDGKAAGYGVFKAANDYGEKYTHEGQWANGLPNGYGHRYFENGSYDYQGNYTDGELDLSLVNVLYNLAADEDDLGFYLSTEEVDFIEQNPHLFPTDDLNTLALYIDENLTYKMLEKNESAYNDSLMIIDPAYVISIDEITFADDLIFSMLLIEDEDYNIYSVYYPSQAEDIYSDDIIGCVGYPIGFSSYENKAGSRTSCPILLGCFITKEN